MGYFKTSKNLPGRTTKIPGESRTPILELKAGPPPAPIRSRNANHCTAVFGTSRNVNRRYAYARTCGFLSLITVQYVGLETGIAYCIYKN
jgi:hypothetical protein